MRPPEAPPAWAPPEPRRGGRNGGAEGVGSRCPELLLAAGADAERWDVSPGIQLAILKRESSFNGRARPARTRLLGFIPGPRPSDAYGYAQALEATWEWYQDETGRGGADRDDFGDAVDFIGWYAHMSGRLSGIDRSDARALYLAYHEGHGGYNRGTYRGKDWLLRAAAQVERDARTYDAQIERCRRRLDRGWIPFL